MSLNGSGVMQINSTGQPVVAATLIDATVFNALTADLATAISTAMMKDGQTTVTADIPFNAHKLTGVAPATARTDAATLATIQDGTGVYVSTVGGTADGITLTASPAITAYVAGMRLYWIASGTNTTSVTVAVNGLAAQALTKNGSTALAANDILSGSMVTAVYDGTRFILVALNVATLRSTLTAHALYVGNGIAAPTALAVGGTNTLLHGMTGADPAFSAVVEADMTLADNTTNNVTSTAHGFCPKAPADATKFLNGANPPAYAVPTGALTAGSSATTNPFTVNSKNQAAHGLGAAPSLIVTYLECLIGELGYNTGDRLYMSADSNLTGSFNWIVRADATNVEIITGSSAPAAISKTTPAGAVALTLADWKVVAVPYKIS